MSIFPTVWRVTAAVLLSHYGVASAALDTAPAGCVGAVSLAGPLKKSGARRFPVQLQMRTPVAPTPVSSNGRAYLFYEIHLSNLSGDPLTMHGIEVIADGAGTSNVIASFGVDVISTVFTAEGFSRPEGTHQLGPGQSTVAFLCVAFDDRVAIPPALRHRVLLSDAVAEGPSVAIVRTPAPVLSRPVTGVGWTAKGHPALDSHHRTGVFVFDGKAQISRRYAIDWKITRNGATFSGDALDVRSYHAYGQKVLAVADGVVFDARDGLPDNIPRTPAGFTPALPVTIDNAAGNFVVVRHGPGQFAFYAHLKPGSVRARKGERVRRGQLLGQIGNSGDARDPHLHFQLTTTPHVMDSEGLPYVLDRYKVQSSEGSWQLRSRELPMTLLPIDFGNEGRP